MKIEFIKPFNQQDEDGWLLPGVATPGLQIDTTQLVEPLDFYKLFLTDELFEEHVVETNKHAGVVRERELGKTRLNSRSHG